MKSLKKKKLSRKQELEMIEKFMADRGVKRSSFLDLEDTENQVAFMQGSSKGIERMNDTYRIFIN